MCIRDRELIYRWRLEFNTQGQPTKRQPAFICISTGPAPNAYFTRRITDKAAHAFGPISGTGRLRAAVESINQSFHLRDCPDKTKFEFDDQPQLFANPKTAKCIRYELGSCPGPCASICSRSHYHGLVEQALEFIRGNDSSVIDRLDKQMKSASASHLFERATIVRDHMNNLSWFNRRMKALRTAEQKFNGVLPIAARKNRTAWLILKGGRIMGSTALPDSPKRALAAIKQLSEIAAQKQQLPASILEMHLQLIVIAWFRKHTAVKKTLIPFDGAIRICESQIDGAEI